MTINSIDPNTFNLANLSSINSFTNVVSEWSNAFAIDGLDINGDFLVTIHGSVMHNDNGTKTPVSMGECGLPDALSCEGEGYDAMHDLEAILRDVLLTQDFVTNINLFDSNYWTTLLQTYLSPTANSTSSVYTNTVSGGIHSDELKFTLEGCDLVLNHSDDNTPARTYTNLIAINGFTATGLADTEGNLHEFYFLATYKVGEIIKTDTVFGSTCFPLRNCKECPDSTNYQADSTEIAQQDQDFKDQGKTFTEESIITYDKYTAAVDELNTRMGWNNGDSLFVQKMQYAKYFHEGMSRSASSYIRYMKHFDPDIDNHDIISHCDSFTTKYGYATNVKLEHKRYKKAMERYNLRAASVSLPALPVMEDTTFAKEKVADSLGYYIAYIETMPNGMTAGDEVFAYLMAENKMDVNFDSLCAIYYDDYIDAYDYFETQQAINNTCLNYQLFSPLYSSTDVKKNNLCCTQAGLDAFVDYIALFYSTTECPGPLPKIESCSIISEIDTNACQKNYIFYVQAIADFNVSPWAIANNQTLPLLYETFDEFIRAGKCECIENWLKYINEYIKAPANEVLPPAEHLDEFADCPEIFAIVGENPCEDAYDEYLECVAVYNQWAKGNGGQSVKDIVKFGTFVSENLCYCVDAYCTALNNVSTGIITVPAEISFVLSIIRVCDLTTTVPCTPELPLTSDFISPPVPYTNPCAEYMINLALENGENAYQQYKDSITKYISSKYNEHCTKAIETFNATYQDKEYHFTLYYYDQAGNLIKTIPPEGIEMLALDNSNPTAAALNNQINADRTNNTQTIFTHHRLATQYEYNSLNQLVKQSMPDHDKMDIFEITLPNGLNAALETSAIQMVNSNLGYLSGFVGTRGYLYQTNDGGVTWTRMNDIVAADLKKIQMVNPTIGYAIGNNGIVLKTINGGSDWDMLNTYQYNVTENLNDLHFTSATDGVIVGDKSRILKTNNGGSTFTTYLLPFSSGSYTTADQNIKSITHDGTAYYITSTRPDGIVTPVYSVIHRSTTANNGPSWNIENQISSVSINDISIYLPNQGFAAGIDGSLLHTDGTIITAVATNTNFPFKQVVFKDGLVGLGLLETSSGVLELFKTQDAGATWDLMSEPGDNYTRLYMYLNSGYGAKVIATGKNGLVQRIIMENNTPFGIIDLNSPSTADITACWGQEINSDLYIVIGNSNGNVFSTQNGSDNIATWTTLSTSLIGTFAKVIEAKNMGTGDAISGTILGNNGIIYSIFKQDANINFNLATFPFIPPGYNMADLTLDNANSRIFTFDNTANQAHKIQLNASILTNTTSPLAAVSSIAQANDITYTDSKLVLAGNDGELFVGTLNPPANVITGGGWAAVTNTIKALPLNDIQFSATTGLIYAAGKNGNILQRQSGGSWKTLISGITENINRINFSTTTDALIAGNNGLIAKTTIAGNIATIVPYSVNTTQNLHDVIRNGNTVYVAGENGTVLYTPNIDVNNFAVTNQYTSKDFYGLAFKPSTPSNTQALVVGENSLVHWCTGAGRTIVKNVFTPILKDVHFADVNNGTLIGDNFTIRKTNDGGVNWKVVMPSDNAPSGIVLNEVQTIDDNYALVVGNNKYLAIIENNICTNNGGLISPPISDLLSIDFNESGLKGFIGNSKSKIYSLTLNPSGGSYTLSVSASINAVSPSPNTDINALWVFDNGSVMLAGENNYVGYFDGVSTWIPITLPSPNGTIFNDIFFHDHLNGYVVGNLGNSPFSAVMLKSKEASLNTNGFLTGINWDTKNIADNLNVTSNAGARINAIAFATRYNGVWGGKYNITNNTQYPYVRLIRDESILFSTYFYYDKLGRIVVSQNTKQFNKTPRAFSYTKYDELGRVVEAGEKQENVAANLKFNSIFGTTVANYYNPKVIDDAKLLSWINGSGNRIEVTRSYYDESIITGLPADFNPNPETQRKRITHVTYEDLLDNNHQTFDHATHYDYDIHGNVKTLLQDNKKLATAGTTMTAGGSSNPIIATERFKRMDYSYDLISGNVHEVDYQKAKADQWSHAYTYDSDNRIKDVYTSNHPMATTIAPTVGGSEGGIWDNDAKYFYYAHGPLARMETGHHDVQGTDYVYNLQGWIKGVNSNTLNTQNDPGADGTGMTASNENALFARDVYGYSLNYFTGDYSAIDANKNLQENSFMASINSSDINANRFDLFNGNIGSMITTITIPDETILPFDQRNRNIKPLGNAYKYDQLNRLLQAVSYKDLDLNTANSTYNSFGTGSAQQYKNTFTFDANGNIVTQLRNDHLNNTIDEMQYKYALDGNGKVIANRLYHVDDAILPGTFTDDIDDMGTFNANLLTINQNNNYSYTEIGELKKDLQEQIAEIVWRVDGKVKEVIRTNGSSRKNLKFEYDAMGNRIAKHIYSSSNNWEKSTFYVRDAQGNVMSVYEETNPSMPSYQMQEQHIYGSYRIGMRTDEKEMIAATVNTKTQKRELGKKQYEFSNHLGNVLTVVSDKKLPIESITSPGEVEYFVCEIVSATDYSSFGCTLEGRNFNSSSYRYSFQNQEKDDELKGEGNSVNFTYRMQYPRLGRFFAVDPLFKKYPHNSVYAFSENKVIAFIELEGLESTNATWFMPEKSGYETKLKTANYVSAFENCSNTEVTEMLLNVAKEGATNLISKVENLFEIPTGNGAGGSTWLGDAIDYLDSQAGGMTMTNSQSDADKAGNDRKGKPENGHVDLTWFSASKAGQTWESPTSIGEKAKNIAEGISGGKKAADESGWFNEKESDKKTKDAGYVGTGKVDTTLHFNGEVFQKDTFLENTKTGETIKNTVSYGTTKDKKETQKGWNSSRDWSK